MGSVGHPTLRRFHPILVLMLVSCGGEEGDNGSSNNGSSGTTSGSSSELQCGPNGRLHIGFGAEPHCDCDDGYQQENGTCVEVVLSPPSGPIDVGDPDCGANGSFNGSFCDCDPGFTQTGLQAQRTCEATPACMGPDDLYEPNDVPAEAVPLSDVQGLLFACPDNADWFTFDVVAGDRVAVEIRFDGDLVDLDLLVYGPSSREPRDFSLSAAGDSETAGFVARADGTAGVYVAPYGLGQGAYELSVDVRAGETPMCGGAGAFCAGSSDCCSGFCHFSHCH